MNELSSPIKDTNYSCSLNLIHTQLHNNQQANKELILYLYYYSGMLLRKLQYNIRETELALYVRRLTKDISLIEENENSSPYLLFKFIRDIHTIECLSKRENLQIFLDNISLIIHK
ncbi:hypothetical protein M3603_15445 [Rummeliibacillus stabekisii]|uniref:hypothetical protein n=1 Tax=Rummeliibacillus stabekisii TaxID=241244 RepID=UPI0020403900|nr:hypothetical protein [Rummeliibacillus stabekisii]MCM3318012.1 hypothetical protein [Rummeliibacillus stabekisii]